ncbi:MAG TPA: MMPL family transporter [Ktedonobacteraceae bacterium]|nr:MMPL family transporter [Ktedonobacteraceae bacterium]
MFHTLLHTVTGWCSSRRGKYITLALWLVAVGVLSALAPRLATLYDNNSSQSLSQDMPSQVAQQLLLKEFPSNRGTPAIVVFSHSSGLTDEDRQAIKPLNDWLLSANRPKGVSQVVSVFTVPQAESQLVSQDKTTMMLLVTFSGSENTATTRLGVEALRQRVQAILSHTALQGHVTGPAGIITDVSDAFASVDLPLLFTTIGLVLVLLILLYRSPLLALLPLVAVGSALQIVNALLAYAAQAGWFSVSQMSSSIATVLLFGAGTDYSIFVASRFREELTRVQDRHEAMQRTMRAIGEAIVSSAGTVILSLLVLLLASLGLYSSLGPTLAITLLVMLLAGLTLVPAMMVSLGRAAFWPFVPRVQTTPAMTTGQMRGFWARLGRWTTAHRWQAVLGSLLLLSVLACGNLGSQPTFNFLTSFRTTTDSSAGYTILQNHFPAGTLAPTTVLLQFKGKQANAYEHLAALDAITTALEKTPGVALVQGPTRPDGKTLLADPSTLQAAIASFPPALKTALQTGQTSSSPCQSPECQTATPQERRLIVAYAASLRFVSADQSTVQLSVTLKDDPYALSSIQRMPTLKTALEQIINQHGLGQAAATHLTPYLAGQTPLLADTLAANQRDTWLIVPVVLVLVGLVLGLLLRSLLAPLYLLGAVTLNFFAAIGACSFVFVRLQGQDGFSYAIPLYTFIFLVALGADYTIFLMARIREEAGRSPLSTAVPVAVAHTGGVITSAGLILAGTFGVLTTLPLNILYQLGICVAVGILMDTFVVRGLLVPGMVLLFGKWNWWPGKSTISAPIPLLHNEKVSPSEGAIRTKG